MSVTNWQANLVQAHLRDEGMFVTAADSGGELFDSLLLLGRPVVILSTDLQDLNWLRAIQRLRGIRRNMSILVLDTRNSPADQAAALEAGADDIVTVHMPPAEISARIRAVMARRAGRAGPNINQGPLRLRMAQRAAFWGPQKIRLTQSQYNIFETLCLATPYAVSRDILMAELYGLEEGSAPETINVFVSNLRGRLVAAGAPRDVIETVPGRGYRLATSVPAEEGCPDGTALAVDGVARLQAA